MNVVNAIEAVSEDGLQVVTESKRVYSRMEDYLNTEKRNFPLKLKFLRGIETELEVYLKRYPLNENINISLNGDYSEEEQRYSRLKNFLFQVVNGSSSANEIY